MRSRRSELRLGARPQLLDGLGDVRCLAGGVAVVDGHFAYFLRRSEHGLPHRETPAANRDQRPVHVILHDVRRGVDRPLDHFDAKEKLVLRERLVEVGEAAKKRPPRRAQPLVRRAQPPAHLVARVRRSGEYRFEIIMRRHELKSTMMTSNRPLEDWGKLIGDIPSATAILDRFLHRSELFQITEILTWQKEWQSCSESTVSASAG